MRSGGFWNLTKVYNEFNINYHLSNIPYLIDNIIWFAGHHIASEKQRRSSNVDGRLPLRWSRHSAERMAGRSGQPDWGEWLYEWITQTTIYKPNRYYRLLLVNWCSTSVNKHTAQTFAFLTLFDAIHNSIPMVWLLRWICGACIIM